MFDTNDSGIGAGSLSRGRLLYVSLFGIAMAYFEAAVVVYLRAIAYPEGFAFPLAGIPSTVAAAEIGREAASLVMILAVAIIAGGNRPQRFAGFLIIFGIWDIFYYVFLELLLGWPASLLTWDVLFLIPVVWAAPVIAPAGVALLMILLGGAVLRGDRKLQRGGSEGMLPEEAFRRHGFRLVRREVLLLIGAAALLFASFVEDFLTFALPRIGDAASGGVPAHLAELGKEYVPGGFPWLLYGGGVLLLTAALVSILQRSRSTAGS